MTEKTIEQYFLDWESETFGFGYGTGEEYTLKALKDFFKLLEKDKSYDHQVLEKEIGGTVAWLMLNILGHADLIEYGTSIRYGWLTEKGEALKKFVDTKTVDELYKLITDSWGNYYHCSPTSCNCGPNGYIKTKNCNNPFF